MSSRVWRVAVAGGRRAVEESWVEGLRELSGSVSVEAVCDPVADQRDRIGRQFGLRPEQRFADLEELLEHTKVDVVVVASPLEAHVEAIVAAADAGKHVFCDEPLAPSIAETDLALATTDQAGVRLGVLHRHRYQAPYRKALWLLHDGAIGVPFSIRAEAFAPGSPEDPVHRSVERPDPGRGCLFELGYPLIYLAREMMGSDVRSVAAVTGTYARPIDVEDHAFVLLRHRNLGATSVQVSWAVPPVATSVFEVYGSMGAISIGRNERPLSLYHSAQGSWEYPEIESGKEIALAFGDFIEAIETGQAPPVSGDEARRNLRILLAAYDAGKTGTVVSVS